MTIIHRPALAQPPVVLSQDDIYDEITRFLGPDFPRLKTVQRIVRNSGVKSRAVYRRVEDILNPPGFGQTQKDYAEACKDLGKRSVVDALENAGVDASEIDLLITTSCTGFMIPSIDAWLIPELGFRRDIVRLPVTELGCAAGAVAFSRAHDYLQAYPDKKVLIVAIETASLCFQPSDLSMQAIVGALLFGDGATACVVSNDGPGFEIETTERYLFEDSWDFMGFDVRDSGFHLVLDKDVPGAVGRQISPVMQGFLERKGVSPKDLGFFCLHPGGRKLMDKITEAFELDDNALIASRECLSDVGNLSSASIGVVLQKIFDDHTPENNARGFFAAFGPGFSVEMGLGRWRQ